MYKMLINLINLEQFQSAAERFNFKEACKRTIPIGEKENSIGLLPLAIQYYLSTLVLHISETEL